MKTFISRWFGETKASRLMGAVLTLLLIFTVKTSFDVFQAYSLRRKIEDSDLEIYERLAKKALAENRIFKEDEAKEEIAKIRNADFLARYNGTTAIDLWCAFAGLIVGVALTFLLHHQSQEQGGRLNEAVDEIKSDQAKVILGNIGLQALNDYGDVHAAIHGRSGIIATAVEESFNLDIINPTAWFGYWLSFDIDNVLSDVSSGGADVGVKSSKLQPWEKRKNRLRSTTASQLYSRWVQENSARNLAMVKLQTLKAPKGSDGNSAKVRCITLDFMPHADIEFRSTQDGNQCDAILWEGASLIPFIREFVGWGLRDVLLCEYSAKDGKLPSQIVGAHDTRKVLMIPSECLEENQRLLRQRPDFAGEIHSNFEEAAKAQQRELRCKFAEHLLWKQKNDIERMESTDLQVQVKRLPEIPFQMFICYGQSLGADKEHKSTALLVFSDKYTIGSNDEEIAGFATRSRKALATMQKTYNQLIASRESLA